LYTGTTDLQYTIAIKTSAGCVTVDTVLVKPLKEVKIYVPTAFSPNKDGLNDYLKPVPAGIKELKYFRIYNRWGQLVFDLRTNEIGWDGNIKGVAQGTGVYVWMAEGVGVDNNIYRGKGTVLLLR
jgi:gliding motility-associated-like protein